MKEYTVMLVDDDVSVRKSLRGMLELAGYPVVTEASDGVEAVERYRQYRPMLTIMDLFMPLKDGLDATSDIVFINPEAKVVICTSMNSVALAARSVGASGVLAKPVVYAQLLEILKSIGAFAYAS